jgi:DNA repair ATPase RecN
VSPQNPTKITLDDLTIRQLKKLAETADVYEYAGLNKAELKEAIRGQMQDEDAIQMMVDALTKPADELEKEEPPVGEHEALVRIFSAYGDVERASDTMKARRAELNQEVAEAKASHKGAMERSVDYNDATDVKEKLIAVTEAWQNWEDSQEHRRLELDPLKEELKAARKRLRKAYEETKQLGLKFD